MCTVLYLPGKEHICFASLRDESPSRALAKFPELVNDGGIAILAPIDPQANGTWLGVNEFGNVLILLNGGFAKHPLGLKYRKSRGLIVTDLLKTELPLVTWRLINLHQIEPFTLVVYSECMLFELVWDGEHKHQRKLNNQESHIWSSSTLFHAEARKNRKDTFDNWIAMQPPLDKLSVLHFFNQHKHDPDNGFIINRNDLVKTLSFTYIEIQKKKVQMDYYDLNAFMHHTAWMPIHTSCLL